MGQITGIVKLLTTPTADIPVHIYLRSTGELIDSTVSAVDGTFGFNDLDSAELYTIVALSDNSNYNDAIDDGIEALNIDPYFGQVVLLLKGEGINGSTTFVDSSSNNYSPDGHNLTNISTVHSKFGTSSIFFQNSDNTFLTWPASTNYNNGNSFTIEFWIRLNSLPSGDTYCLATSNVRYFSLTSTGVFSSTAFGGNNLVFGTLSINTWYWCVLVYDKNIPRTSAYLNGTRISTSTTLATSYTTTNEKFGISSCPDISFLRELKNAYVDEFRFTRVARYNPELTGIPVQTESWPSE
jgi:hypothetical protein